MNRRDFLIGSAASVGIPITGLSRPINSLVASSGEKSATGGGVGWKNPYVTDGLVGMWDGEWNAGPGVHDPNATTWKDLSGNGQDCYQNGDIATPLIGDNCIYFDTTRRSFVFDFIPSVASTKFIGLTVEICGDFSGAGTNPNFFSASPFNAYKGDFVSRYAASQLGISSYSTQVLTGISLPRYGFSATTTSSGYLVYVRGTLAASKTCSFTSNLDIQSGYFGYAVSSQIENPRGSKIYGARIYSRALTADEIAHNYAIDKARFNLP